MCFLGHDLMRGQKQLSQKWVCGIYYYSSP
ncbi:hypothetical protein ACUXOL_001216 [Staphylococcus epidermidis]